MGGKGSNTTTTSQNQTSTYAPTAQAQGYITNAMNMATGAASNPFAIPQAPVAGFSQDQQGAFQQFRDAQGAAQPYYNQASNYFSPEGAQAFMNPYADSVMAGMKDVFGAQQSQLNGNLVGAAGGVGADRIGVGQAELGKQQSLAAGQTLSGMYNQSVQQAQAAGQGQMALGANAQNSQLQGANAMLASGGLQQQLQQAQMNSPYQQALAQAAFPYQQAQFLAGITGALAPGLGGTTNSYGTGTSAGPTPSMLSQIIGGGAAVAGGLGASGAFGSNGWMTGGGGNWAQNNPGVAGSAYYGPAAPGSARGGRINPYAEGGGVPTDPIDISQQSIIPTGQLTPIQAHIPQANLNLNPPAAAKGGDSTLGDIASIAKTAGSVAMMFSDERLKENVKSVGKTHDGQNIYSYNFKGSPQTQMGMLAQEVEQRHPEAVGEAGGYKTVDYDEATKGSHRADGGRVNPYAALTGYDEGGPVDVFGDDNRARAYDLLRQGVGTHAPDSIPGGEPAPVVNPDEPFRLDPAATEAWRRNTPIIAGGENPGGAPPRAMAFAGPDAEPESPAVSAITSAYGPPGSSGLKRTADATQDVSPYSQGTAAPAKREPGFIDSPWAALMAAGLGIMGGTSPYAGVNIGQGAMQGVKTLQAQRENAQKDETIDQASRRLSQEAQFHNDQYTRMTPYQKGTLEQQKAALDAEKYVNAGSIMTKNGLHPAVMDTKSGKIVDGITGQPPTETDTVIAKGASRNSPEEISGVVQGIIDGSQPPTLTGLYGDSIHVRSGLQKAGFNLAKAQQEWKNAERLGASVNSSRMTTYVGLNNAVDKTIDRVRELSQQLQLSGVPLLNKTQLASYMKLQGNSEKGQLATQYMTAVNTLKEEFANLANGGYAPTEAAWKLANEQVNGDYGVKQLGASIDEIQRLIRYRLQSVPGLATLGPNSTNRYSGQGAGPPAHGAPAGGTPPPAAGGATPPAGGGGMKPSPDGKGPLEAAKRFGELTGLGGKTEEQIWGILNDEGFHQ